MKVAYVKLVEGQVKKPQEITWGEDTKLNLFNACKYANATGEDTLPLVFLHDWSTNCDIEASLIDTCFDISATREMFEQDPVKYGIPITFTESLREDKLK